MILPGVCIGMYVVKGKDWRSDWSRYWNKWPAKIMKINADEGRVSLLFKDGERGVFSYGAEDEWGEEILIEVMPRGPNKKCIRGKSCFKSYMCALKRVQEPKCYCEYERK